MYGDDGNNDIDYLKQEQERIACNQQAAQAAPARPFGVSLLDALKLTYRQKAEHIRAFQDSQETRAKVIDILTAHPEFQDFIYVLQHIEA